MRYVALLGVLLSAAVACAATPKPNVVFILADDMGYADAGCYVLGAPGVMIMAPLPGGEMRIGIQFRRTQRGYCVHVYALMTFALQHRGVGSTFSSGYVYARGNGFAA